MAKQIDSEMLDHLVNEMSDKKSIFRVAMKVENSAGSVSGKAAAGEMQVDSKINRNKKNHLRRIRTGGSTIGVFAAYNRYHSTRQGSYQRTYLVPR